jgi:hypothetical protein
MNVEGVPPNATEMKATNQWQRMHTLEAAQGNLIYTGAHRTIKYISTDGGAWQGFIAPVHVRPLMPGSIAEGHMECVFSAMTYHAFIGLASGIHLLESGGVYKYVPTHAVIFNTGIDPKLRVLAASSDPPNFDTELLTAELDGTYEDVLTATDNVTNFDIALRNWYKISLDFARNGDVVSLRAAITINGTLVKQTEPIVDSMFTFPIDGWHPVIGLINSDVNTFEFNECKVTR